MLRWSCVVVALALAGLAARGGSRAGGLLAITRGGTYGGDYSAIRIDTSEPVIIENASLRGNGTLISSHYRHANVTIRNVRAAGPDAGHHAGRFIKLEGFDNVTVENCLLDHTEGIYLRDYAGDRTPANTVKILRNVARNIDGRSESDAPGAEPALVQFVQLHDVRRVPGMEIAWNQVINEPVLSRVEDNVNIFESSGTPRSPLKIHDNFIRGAYPAEPARQNYSGGGILLGDGVSSDGIDGDSSFVHAFNNQVMDTTNYGIAIAAGHDNQIDRNRVVSTGVLPDGRPIAAQNVGVYIWDSYHAGPKRFFNNSGRDNLIGWSKGAGRNDWWTPDAASWQNNTPWSGPIDRNVYEHEWARWRQKLQTAKITIGPTTRPSRP